MDARSNTGGNSMLNGNFGIQNIVNFIISIYSNYFRTSNWFIFISKFYDWNSNTFSKYTKSKSITLRSSIKVFIKAELGRNERWYKMEFTLSWIL